MGEVSKFRRTVRSAELQVKQWNLWPCNLPSDRSYRYLQWWQTSFPVAGTLSEAMSGFRLQVTKLKTVNQNGCGKHTGQAPKRNIKSNHNMSRDSQNPILSAVKVASVHQPSPTPQSGRGHSIFDVVDAADKVFIRIHYVGRGHPQAPRSCLFSPRSQAVNRGPHAVMMISLYPMSSALQGPQAQSIVDRFWNIEQPIACLPQETSNSFR